MILALVAACHPDEPTPTPTPPDYDLTFEAGVLALRRDGEVLLELPIEGITIGEVAAWEEFRSYDPFYPDELAEGGVTWRTATGSTGAWPNLTLRFEGGASATLTGSEPGEGRFSFDVVPTAGEAPIAYLRLRATIDPLEGLYGLGSALDTPNRRGSIRAVQVELDPSTEAASNEAHVHVPLVIGTTGWGMFVADDHPMVFELGVEADELLQVTVGTGEDTAEGLRFDWYVADHPLDVTARYWAATGIHRLPARWALGPLLWRDENEDQAQVERDLQTIRDLDLATSAVWIDRPYASGVNTFDFDPAKFPDPQGMIDRAHDLGFRMSLWHTPYADPEEAAALYAEGLANGYFPPVHPPVFIDWSEPVDLSNPEAFAWWQAEIDKYKALGIEGYKLDYAEEILVGAFGGRLPWLFWNGDDERTMHAEYQRLYHRVYAETLPEDGGFLLCRTGVFGDQVNGPIIWPGDLDATMDRWGDPAVDRDGEPYIALGGLPASLVDGLSLGPSGFPFYGSDTGGYRHSPPDNETFVRWFEQTALSTVMQIGTSTNDVVWEPTAENGFDEQTLDWYRDYVRLHLRLWPYLWTYAEEIGRGEGRPIMRPLGLAYPELGVHPGDSYLLGDHLLVAPVVDRGAREREVVFPPGRWIDWFRGEVHEPGTETVPADLGELPLYLAAGGIVPMLRPTIDTLSPTTRPEEVDSFATTAGVLWVRIFPGPRSELTVFDGSRITERVAEGVVIVEWTGGDTFVDGAWIELVGTGEPEEVEVDGGSAEWSWSPEVGGTVSVRVPAGAHEVRVRD